MPLPDTCAFTACAIVSGAATVIVAPGPPLPPPAPPKPRKPPLMEATAAVSRLALRCGMTTKRWNDKQSPGPAGEDDLGRQGRRGHGVGAVPGLHLGLLPRGEADSSAALRNDKQRRRGRRGRGVCAALAGGYGLA